MELLAPAGNKDAFYAALGSGANAIYLGLEVLNARRQAQNVTLSELPELTRLAHLFETKVYLTLNTIILDSECVQALDLVEKAWAAGVDAIIVQDIGLLTQIRQQLPDVRLHASTQINVHNADTLRALAELGVARVTLARELSLEEIEVLAAVAREAGIEVEVFGHGALCVCYSGQCLFSSLVGRRSANRGLCAQPCRLPYELIDHRGDLQETRGPFLLSPKDLMSIDYLERLEAAGVASLKIEGRMKKPAYVAAVVSTYRCLSEEASEQSGGTPPVLGSSDSRNITSLPLRSGRSYPNSAPSASQVLTDAFNRALTSGYLSRQHGEGLMDYHRTKNPTTREAQEALTAAADDLIVQIQAFRQPLNFSARVKVGEPLLVEVADAAGRTGSSTGEVVEVARTKTITEEEIRAQLSRLGNTPYEMDALTIDLDKTAGMNYSLLNRARREAIENYEMRLQ